jgi:hypothetical protein
METNLHIRTSVREALDKQRDETDARAIINEVERINTLEGLQRYRWIWELVQNARDEAGEGIDITCELNDSSFQFSHNGKVFANEHLLALLRKTSTKPIDGAEGNTGKFGTGFVLSHLLNKFVTVTGVHKNELGERNFELKIDRRANNLEEMKEVISNGIQEIEKIDARPCDDLLLTKHSFHYVLNKVTYEIAEGGIAQLETNLPFAILVNRKIRTVNIQDAKGKRSYHTNVEDNKIGNLSFMRLEDLHGSLNPLGLLFQRSERMTIAVPAIEKGDIYLLPIKEQARLFKDLPLIGTEHLYLPVIMQHVNFLPTESRDGVRTRLSSDAAENEDIHAITNRQAFKEFVYLFPSFLDTLINGNVKNQHLLAESGLPPNVEAYYDKDWFTINVQQPIREAVLSHDIVNTVSGHKIGISQAIFIDCDPEYQAAFFSLISKWFPNQCPNEESYQDWVSIISQQPEKWPEGIIVDINRLVQDVASKGSIEYFDMEGADALAWLQELIVFLEATNQTPLGHDYTIYPNQDGKLVLNNEIFHETGIDLRFKGISNGMGRRLEAELLPQMFEAKFVEDFDEKEFLIDLNNNIGKLIIKEATAEQIKAVIDICCSFRSSKAERRDQWYDLIHELLPEIATNRVIVEVNEDYQFEPAEKCSLKYVCYLIEESKSLIQFPEQYFDNDCERAMQWLNNLYDFVFRNEENKAAALIYKIVPTQDGLFKQYTEDIFREDNLNHFDDVIKDLYNQYSKNGDPRTFLVNNGIINTNLRATSLRKLAIVIDDIFNDRDSEDKVKEGEVLHDLFLKLKEWIDNNPLVGEEYFPIFCKKQPVLYIKAFGGAKFSRLLKLNKTVEEIEKLDKLRLGAEELKKIDDAVAELGSSEQLLVKAKEMIDYAELIRWRQAVGAAAERAFLEAICEAEDKFDKENPDIGKDFVIKFNDKEYSIELKSAVEGKETVKMSLLQGEYASNEKDHYALCVISRPSGLLTTKEQFIEKAKFVTNIGELIGDKVQNWRAGLRNLETEGDVKVELDSKSGAINIRKNVWSDEKNFEQFIIYLRRYFEI